MLQEVFRKRKEQGNRGENWDRNEKSPTSGEKSGFSIQLLQGSKRVISVSNGSSTDDVQNGFVSIISTASSSCEVEGVPFHQLNSQCR